MEWQTLKSAMFFSAAYDANARTLYLRFRSADVYRYFDFPEHLYNDFLSAESHGRFFLSHIREEYRYQRLAKLRVA